jgi:hypothetical protein
MSSHVQRMHDAARKQMVSAQLLMNDVLMMSSPAIRHKREALDATSASARARGAKL